MEIITQVPTSKISIGPLLKILLMTRIHLWNATLIKICQKKILKKKMISTQKVTEEKIQHLQNDNFEDIATTSENHDVNNEEIPIAVNRAGELIARTSQIVDYQQREPLGCCCSSRKK
jgi:hypothetical protein